MKLGVTGAPEFFHSHGVLGALQSQHGQLEIKAGQKRQMQEPTDEDWEMRM